MQGGVLDVAGASRIVLRDWSTGKLPRYTVPSSSTSAPSNPSLVSHHASDESILSTIPTRKESRKGRGLVKLTSANVESRHLALEASWLPSDKESDDDDAEGEDAEDEEGDDEDVEDVDGEDEDEDEQEEVGDEGDEEGDDESEEELPVKAKRKRAFEADALAARPKKKVAFLPEPKDTKQARKAAGAHGSLLAKQQANAASAPAPVKTALKAAKVKPTVAAPKKVANSGPSKKSVTTSTGSNTGEEEYDFKKFF